MAKTQAITSLSPSVFLDGGNIFWDDVMAVSNLLNWVVGSKPHVLFSTCTSSGGSVKKKPATIAFPFTASDVFESALFFWVYIDPDVQNISVLFTPLFFTEGEYEFRFTIGDADPIVHDLTDLDDGERFLEFMDTADTGTGLKACHFEVKTHLMTGDPPESKHANVIDTLWIIEDTMASLPDPVSE